jgi:hypothetical protein
MFPRQSLTPSAALSPQRGQRQSVEELLAGAWVFRSDLDYHCLRASMVLIFFFFGYQKWFDYEAQGLIPFISNGPLISWMYPVFGIRGPPGSWELRNGSLAPSCSWDSGASDWESSAQQARASRS